MMEFFRAQTLRITLLLCLGFTLLAGCGEITPLWKGYFKLKNLTLYTNEPCEYKVSIQDERPELLVNLELTITHYIKISRTSLPLSIFLERNVDDSTYVVKEYEVEIPLKEDGEWKGELVNDGVDIALTYVAIPRLNLQPGDYTLKIYADALKETTGEIEGVAQIDARFYEVQDIEN
ncbi:MAG: hypothetical protein AAFR61_18535 [Bacteroidota bacterium]